MYYTAKELGCLLRSTRKAQGVTQKQLALISGTGLRFISDLENGKPSCELEKSLRVINSLGIKMRLQLPETDDDE